MKKCQYCENFNDEKEDIEITGIKLSRAGHYNYYCPIKYCPACGKILDKYKEDK